MIWWHPVHLACMLLQTLISPEEMALPLNEQETERKMAQLLQLIRSASDRLLAEDSPLERPSLAARDAAGILRVTEPCTAKGTGLVVGVMGKISRFNVFFTTKETLSLLVRISDPDGEVCNEKIAEFNRNRRSSLLPGTGQSSKIWSIGSKTIQLWRQSNGLAANQGSALQLRKIPFDYQCLSEGHILISYIPRATGTHTVEVLWQGQHIRCSPYSVRVVGSIEQLTRQSTAGRAAVKKVCFQNDQSQDSQTSENDCHVGAGRRGSTRRVPNSLNVKTPKLHKQATITRRRVLRRIMTKAGQEIVIHEVPSPSPRESPHNQGGFQVPQRHGSPSPKPLIPSGSLDYDSESATETTPVDDTVSVVDKFKKTEVMADAMVHTIMNSVLESVGQNITARQEPTCTDDPADPIVAPNGKLALSPIPSQFGVMPMTTDEVLKKPIPIKASSIPDSNTFDHQESQTHVSPKPIVSVNITPTSPVLNITPSLLTVPLSDNNFKSGPYSRCLSPFSRGRYEDESESYTSESESYTSTSKEGSDTKPKGSVAFPKSQQCTQQIKEEEGELNSNDDNVENESEVEDTVVTAEPPAKPRRRADEIYASFNNEVFTNTNLDLVTVRTQIKPAMTHKTKVIRRRDFKIKYGNNENGSQAKPRESVKKTMSDPTKHKRLTMLPTRSKTVSSIDLSDSTDSTSDNKTEDEIPLKCLKSGSLNKSCYYISHKAFDSTFSLRSQNSLDSPRDERDPVLQLSTRRFSSGCKRKLAMSASLPSLSKNWTAFEYDPGEEPCDPGHLNSDRAFILNKRATLATTGLSHSIDEFAKSHQNPFSGIKDLITEDKDDQETNTYQPTTLGKQRRFSMGDNLQTLFSQQLEMPEKNGGEKCKAHSNISDNIEMRDAVEPQNNPNMESPYMSRKGYSDTDDTPGISSGESESDTKESGSSQDKIINGIQENTGKIHFNLLVPVSTGSPNHLDPASCYRINKSPPLYGSPPPVAEKQPQSLTPVQEAKQGIFDDTGSYKSAITKANVLKIDRCTQVTYSEIKQETKWRTRVLNNPQLRHRRTPQKVLKSSTAIGIDTRKTDSAVPPSASSKNFSQHVPVAVESELNQELHPRSSNLPTQPLSTNSSAGIRSQMTIDTSDSGIQDDHAAISPNGVVSTIPLGGLVPATQHIPRRPCPRYVSGHRVLARRIYRRQTSIDDSILQHNDEDNKGKTSVLTLSKLTKAVSGIKRFKEYASKERRSGSERRRGNRCSRVGLHRRKVTFSRRVMIHRRSSTKSSRSSRHTATLDSRSKATTSSTSKEIVTNSVDSQVKEEAKTTLESLSEFIAATSNVPQHMRKFDIANWVSKTTNRFDSNGSSSSIDFSDDLTKYAAPKCSSCNFKDNLLSTTSTASVGEMLSPLSSVTCTCKKNVSSGNPRQDFQSSVDSNYSGFGVSTSRRNELISEIQAFGDILTNTHATEVSSNGEIPAHRSVEVSTSAELSTIPDNSTDRSHFQPPDGIQTPSSYDSEVARLTKTSGSSGSPSKFVDASDLTPQMDIQDPLPSSPMTEDEGDLQELMDYVMRMSTSSYEDNSLLDCIEEVTNENSPYISPVGGSPRAVVNVIPDKVMAYGAGLQHGTVATSNNFQVITQISRFMRPTWGQPGADRTKVGPHVGPMNLAVRVHSFE